MSPSLVPRLPARWQQGLEQARPMQGSGFLCKGGRGRHPGGPSSDGPLPTDLGAHYHRVLGWQTGLRPAGDQRGWETQAGKGQEAHSGFGYEPLPAVTQTSSTQPGKALKRGQGCCYSLEGSPEGSRLPTRQSTSCKHLLCARPRVPGTTWNKDEQGTHGPGGNWANGTQGTPPEMSAV